LAWHCSNDHGSYPLSENLILLMILSTVEGSTVVGNKCEECRRERLRLTH